MASTVRVPLARRSLRYTAVALVAGGVLAASIVRPTPGPERYLLGIGVDKWLHAAAYAVLAGAGGYALLSAGRRPPTRSIAVVCLGTVAFGVGIELIQWPLPYRSTSVGDVLADAGGAVLGALPWRFAAGASDEGGSTTGTDPKALSRRGGKGGQ